MLIPLAIVWGHLHGERYPVGNSGYANNQVMFCDPVGLSLTAWNKVGLLDLNQYWATLTDVSILIFSIVPWRF